MKSEAISKQNQHLSDLGFSGSLLEFLKSYPFVHNPFDPSDKSQYSLQQKYRYVIRVITDKLQEYIANHPNDFQVRTAIANKLKGEELEDFLDGNYPSELIDFKTIIRYFEAKDKITPKLKAAAQKNIAVLEAFQTIASKEQERRKQIARCAGIYHEWAMHNSPAGRFQKSILEIDENGQARTKYINYENEEVTRKLTVEPFGDKSLLLSYKEADYTLIFYIYTGTQNQPNFLQGINLYSYRRGTIVSTLSVFERIKVDEETDYFDRFVPLRDLKEIPEDETKSVVETDRSLFLEQNMQYFLAQYGRPQSIFLHHKEPFDFSKSVPFYPGSYRMPAQSYQHYKRLTGTYSIYFNENFPSIKEENISQNPYLSTIGIGTLSITVDTLSGALFCNFKVPKDEKTTLYYEGVVVNHQLNADSYLLLSLHRKPENGRSLQLIFTIDNDNEKLLSGCYQIGYSKKGVLGAGVVFALKQAAKAKVEVTAISPLTIDSKDSLEQKIQLFLAQTSRSLVVPPNLKQLMDIEPIPYQGSYYVHHFNKQGQLCTGLLLIHASGYVKYIDSSEKEHTGLAEFANDRLTINLKNGHHQLYGSFIIQTDSLSRSHPSSVSRYRSHYAGLASCTNSNDPKAVSLDCMIEYIHDAFIIDKKETKKLWSIGEKASQFLSKELEVLYFLENKATFSTSRKTIAWQEESEKSNIYKNLLSAIQKNDTKQVIQSLIEKAAAEFHVQGGKVYIQSGENQLELVALSGIYSPDLRVGDVLDYSKGEEGEGMAGSVMKSKKLLIVNDYQKWNGHIRRLGHLFGSVLEIPLVNYNNKVIGVASIFDEKDGKKFTTKDSEALEKYGQGIIWHIENALIHEERFKNQQEQRILRKHYDYIDHAVSWEEVTKRILKTADKLLLYCRATLQMIRGDGRELADYHKLPKKKISHELLGAISTSEPIMEIMETKKPLIIPDVRKEEKLWGKYLKNPYTSDIKSWIGIPLLFAGEVIAVMTIDSTKEYGFYNRINSDILALFGEYAAIKLKEFETDRKHHIVKEITQNIYEKKEKGIDALLSCLVEQVVIHFNCPRCRLFLVKDSMNNEIILQPAYQYSELSDKMNNKSKHRSFKSGEGIVGMAFKEGEPILCPDTKKENNFIKLEGYTDVAQSLLAVALKNSNDIPIGVIVLDNQHKRWFRQSDREILSEVASRIALFIDTVSFPSLSQRLQEEQDLKKGFDIILKCSVELTRFQVASLYIENESSYDIYPLDSLLPFDDYLKFVRNRAYEEQKEQLIDDVYAESQNSNKKSTDAGIISMICIPIFDGNKPLGSLNAYYRGDKSLERKELELNILKFFAKLVLYKILEKQNAGNKKDSVLKTINQYVTDLEKMGVSQFLEDGKLISLGNPSLIPEEMPYFNPN